MGVKTGQLRRWQSNGILFVVTRIEPSHHERFTKVCTHLATTDVWYRGMYAGEWDGRRDEWYSAQDILSDSDEVQNAD